VDEHREQAAPGARERAPKSLREHRDEEGASAVEFALIAPLLFMLIFGIIYFGIAFLNLQTLRSSVREGGRAAAVGAPTVEAVRAKVDNAALGAIPDAGDVVVSRLCDGDESVGEDVTVSYDTRNLPEGGIVVSAPFLPPIHMTPIVSASFRCEV
jgi:Flp pilus assembly protein TadG